MLTESPPSIWVMSSIVTEVGVMTESPTVGKRLPQQIHTMVMADLAMEVMRSKSQYTRDYTEEARTYTPFRPLQVKSTLMVNVPPGMAGYKSKSMVMYKEEPLI